MTKTIWKYELQLTDIQAIRLPKGAGILTIQLQRDKPMLWALVDDPFQETEERMIKIFGTGHKIEFNYYDLNRMKYIGTIQFFGRNAVFHFFELKTL